MTPLKYITSPEFGCCSTSELMAASKADATLLPTLKAWAIEEMKKKGIEVTESPVK